MVLVDKLWFLPTVPSQLGQSRRICEESRYAWQALQSPCPTGEALPPVSST